MSDDPPDSTGDDSPPSRTLFFVLDQPSLDWVSEGREFIERLHQRVAELTGVATTSLSMTTARLGRNEEESVYHRYTFPGADLATALAAVPLKGGSWRLAVEATDRREADSDAPLWATAIREAQAGLGDASPYKWWAIVAPTSSIIGPLMLNGSHELSGITLEQPVVPYARFAREPGPHRFGGGGSIEVIYPVVAAGTVAGYSADAAMQPANAELLALCASLTLDTEVYWEVLQAPQPYPRDPASLPSAEEPSLESNARGNYELRYVTPSELTAETVVAMDADPEIAELVAAAYHACTVQQHSPSLAAVMFVGVVETIGARWVSLKKCACCPKCKQRSGYTNRFREAIKLVLPDQADASRLASLLYDRRSKTAHQGGLHGQEFSLWSMPSLFARDPADHFLYQEVWPLRSATHRLLRRLVKNQLPLPPLDPATENAGRFR